jgi:hypothetical protein
VSFTLNTVCPATLTNCPAVTSYTVTAFDSTGTTPIVPAITATGAGPTIPVTGLTIGVAYTFKVFATNSVGPSLPSAPSGVVTPITVPGAPTITSFTVGNQTATIVFSAPATGGGAIDLYTATAFDSTGTTPIVPAIVVTGASTSITVPSPLLTNGTTYTFKVNAHNSAGTGLNSPASGLVIPTAGLVPPAPTIVSAVSVSTTNPGSATVTISDPSLVAPLCVLPTCPLIDSYTVTSVPPASSVTLANSGTFPQGLAIGGLAVGTSYTFRVTAHNSIGTGAVATSSAVPISSVPAAPAAPIATATGNTGQVSVAFVAPANNGSAITNYTVRVTRVSGPAGVGEPVSVTPVPASTVSPILVNNLANGSTYKFTVEAINSVGNGAASPFSNIVAPLFAPAACSSTTPVLSGGISLRADANRLSGAGPLAVFFDATQTTHATVRPFHDIEYRWDFGDPDGTTWGYGSRAAVSTRNMATGPVAAHVFESPVGVPFNVILTAFDGTNTASCGMQITVDDPNLQFPTTNTICFSNAVAGFTGCPTGANQITTANFTTAINTFQGTGKRLLFRRGDTFTASAPGVIKAAGPGIVGAFGSGAKPIIRSTNTSGALKLSDSFRPLATTADWRIMDLEIDANGGAFPGSNGIDLLGGMTQLTILRTDIHDANMGFLLNISLLDIINAASPKAPIWDQIFLVDNTIKTGRGNYAILASATRLALLWNQFFDTETFPNLHMVRTEFAQKAVISNNEFNKSRAGTTLLTLRAQDQLGTNSVPPGTFSEKLLVSDNKFVGTLNPNLLTIRYGTGGVKELLRDVIVERNWFVFGPGTSYVGEMQASNATIRNNIYDTTLGSSSYIASLQIGTSGSDPIQNNVSVYNNTLYSNAAINGFDFMDVQSAPTNVSIINNLIYAPLYTGNFNIAPGLGAGGTLLTNSSNAPAGGQIKNTDPKFTSVAPFNPANAKPTGTCGVGTPSYAICAGTSVPVWSDFFLTPQPATRTIGAVNP